ncbi:MAG: hypothetical protein ACFFCM_08400 [Promethearchaeota archaeon]
MKIDYSWRYASFILGQIFGFALFFLSLTIYQPQDYNGANVILLILDIFPVSVILIILGSVSLLWGLKEEWDELWKVMSINSSIIINTILLLLGYVIFEKSYSGSALFSGPFTPDIYIGTILIYTAILGNIGISGILTLSYGFKIRRKTLILLFSSITIAYVFLLLGSSTFILDFISINKFNLLHISHAPLYLIIGLVFSGIYSFFLILLGEDIFQITHVIKPLREDEPLKKLSEILKVEIEALKNMDIFTIGDLAHEEDQEVLSKITKIKLDRINLLIKLAKESISKKKKPLNSKK